MYCSYVISCIVLMFALFVSVMKCADGFFNVLFLEITNSRYQNKIMLCTLSQEDILAFKIDDDDILVFRIYWQLLLMLSVTCLI